MYGSGSLSLLRDYLFFTFQLSAIVFIFQFYRFLISNSTSFNPQRLRPAHVHKWICHWAFRNITTSTFNDDPILPIQSFCQLTLITVETIIQDPIIITEIPIQSEAHLALIPVFHKENMTLGYDLCFSSDLD